MVIFTPGDRDCLRSTLIARAQADGRISAGAITGSSAVGREDQWSDIDLAFGVVDDPLVDAVLGDFTEDLYENHEAVHHVDLVSGGAIYRAFLLRNTLQVDLAFAPVKDFRATGPTFQLVFGPPPKEMPTPLPPLEHWIGWAWLYALHARSSIHRAQWWRAEYMISGLRDSVLTLACARLDLPVYQARGVDRLPTTISRPLERALVRALNARELVRSLAATVDALLREIGAVDPILKERLEPSLTALVEGFST